MNFCFRDSLSSPGDNHRIRIYYTCTSKEPVPVAVRSKA